MKSSAPRPSCSSGSSRRDSVRTARLSRAQLFRQAPAAQPVALDLKILSQNLKDIEFIVLTGFPLGEQQKAEQEVNAANTVADLMEAALAHMETWGKKATSVRENRRIVRAYIAGPSGRRRVDSAQRVAAEIIDQCQTKQR